jgi:hypothetical protein
MNLYCLEDFKTAVEKLGKNKSYSNIEQSVIEYYCNKSIDQVKSGVNLNASDTVPYLKKRLEGSGGYRVYFLILIKNDCLYLMYIHPKTGAEGSENITEEARKGFYKKILACIKTDEGLYDVKPDADGKKLLFSVKAKSAKSSALS